MIRTGYSFHTAIGNINDVLDRLINIGYPAAPICDRNSTFGFNRFTKAAKEKGIRPVYGVELACVAELKLRKPEMDHWSFLAKDSLRPLHDLIYLATSNAKVPQLLYRQAIEAADGLICITGNRTLLQHVPADAPVYFSIRPSTPRGLYRQATAQGRQFIACSDNYYVNEADRELYRVALGRRADAQTYPQHILSDVEWTDAVKPFVSEQHIAEALANAKQVMHSCQAQLRKATLLKPQTTKTLHELCIEGAQRLGIDLSNTVYQERLNKELKLIEEKAFADYFHIIADMVNFAKQHMIVGPARGSSCGSLVCYLLNITSIDPIPHGLIFERFIDINRNDLPDIDIDFSDKRRDMIFDYAEKKYGRQHVARLGTVTLFRARSALNQAGIALRIRQFEIDKVADTVIERSHGDARAMQTLEDTLNDTETGRSFKERFPEATIITRMEGQPNNASQHAAGIVLTNTPIIDYVAINASTVETTTDQTKTDLGTVMCDKRDTDAFNLLKIDALGLTQLSVFERTLQLAGKPQLGFLEQLPLTDQLAFDVLNQGKFSGIFQFQGTVLQSTTRDFAKAGKPVNHFNDLVQITAACRPGPSASGGMHTWLQRRLGHEPITPVHPILDAITAETYGVPLFQEQTMQIVRQIGNFDWADTSIIRKVISSSQGEEFFARFKDKFLTGAASNGLTEIQATQIWESIVTMGNWQMNKSHCVAYGVVSYWCCWLKAYHPIEFAAATLDAEPEPSRQIMMLRELKAEGIDYIPFDEHLSAENWTPIERNGKRLVIGPITIIKNIGPSKMREILQARNNPDEVLRDAIKKQLVNVKTEIDTLYPIADAIKRVAPDLKQAKIESTPVPCCEIEKGSHVGEIVVIGLAERIVTIDENEPIRVLRRGGRRFRGQTAALNIFLKDDTGNLLCRIDHHLFPTIGQKVVDYGKPGKALYALKGFIPDKFRMMMVKRVKLLGDIDSAGCSPTPDIPEVSAAVSLAVG